MKRTLSFIALVAVVCLATPSFAGSPVEQFKGGVKDVVMSPLHVRDNVKSESTEGKFLPFALIGGALKGSFYMGKQMVTGAHHAVTAPMAVLK